MLRNSKRGDAMLARSVKWLLPVAVVVLGAGLAACGSTPEPPGAGTAASINLSLTTVPTIRSVTVSPGNAQIGGCSGGLATNNTKSTAKKLGYPDGRCWFGKPGLNGIFPITITNKGIASEIYVSGSSATPADNGTGWTLCNIGKDPAVACAGRLHLVPGVDQYLLRNFSPLDKPDYGGLTVDPACDHVFGVSHSCLASQGMGQAEGIELIGPASSSDNSTQWTVTITWMPVPR
jgi:hypothetical protein